MGVGAITIADEILDLIEEKTTGRADRQEIIEVVYYGVEQMLEENDDDNARH